MVGGLLIPLGALLAFSVRPWAIGFVHIAPPAFSSLVHGAAGVAHSASGWSTATECRAAQILSQVTTIAQIHY